MPDLQYNHYYRYEELTTLLQGFASEYPALVQISSLGKSYEGRDIWLATVTNSATGPAEEKPALWVDGNIHATEVSPTHACLHLLHSLCTRYGKDAEATRCLDTRAFYICPRINPDGAELALSDKPRFLRSSTRPWPYDEENYEGLTANEDIDGDGRVLWMRIPDPNGAWKKSEADARLMVRRDPTETGGQYYRLLPEGFVEDYDGYTLRTKPVKERLDMNRNFPNQWRPEGEQPGAGPYPTSEPEVHAVVDFVARHRNLTGVITFHTWSGVLLRPYGTQSDEAFPAEDLWAYKAIGEKGTQITGYPNVSVYHDFRYHPKEIITGVFDDWAYDQLGLFGWTVEIWSPQRQAGITDYKYIDWYREHPIEDDLKMLKWNDEVLEGQGYIDWYEFDHPQLGKIELGGWNTVFCWRNPPMKFLEKEVAPFSDWLIWHLLISPRLEKVETIVTPLGEDVYRVRLFVQNSGWLPSYVSKKTLERKAVRGVIAEIELPEGAALQSGKKREELGQLEGRSGTSSAASPFSIDGGTPDRLKVEWVLRAPKGSRIQVKIQHDRAGVIHEEITL